MEIKASAKFVKGSPRKIVRIATAVKGRPANEALNLLKFSPTTSSTLIEKLLKAALANAKQHNLNTNNLYIKELVVNRGPMMKRFKAASRYHIKTIRRRTSHLNILLAEKI